MATRDENIVYQQVKMDEEKQPLTKSPKSPIAGSLKLDDMNHGIASPTSNFQPFETEDIGNVTACIEDEEDPTQGNAYNPTKIPYHDQSSPHYTVFSTILPYFLLRCLFPPNVPRAVQLLRKENMAIPMCYLTVGLLQGLSRPFINVYPLFLDATEAQQTVILSISSLPALFKIFFGFWSDNVPLWGYRRKSYMFIGWLMSSLSMVSLLSFSDLSRVANGFDDNGAIQYAPTEGAPSIPFLSATLLLFGTGFWFADVMGDSIVAEKAKLEPEETRGQLQSTCYSCRFFGLMVTAPVSTVLYHRYGPEIVVKLMGLVPMVMLPFIYNFWERKDIPVKSAPDQCKEIWTTVCSRAVWQPMAFVYIYNVLQVGNAAWKEYLRSVLNFSDVQLNILLIAAYVLLYLGVLVYKYYLIKWSWRSIYIITTALNAVFSTLQVLLIQGITFGLSPFVFALGDDVFLDFIEGIQFLPTTIMMVHLCPAGSEGASYAMFTTVHNCASSLSSTLSTLVLGIWDCSKETMIKGDLSGMTYLTIFTTILQTCGLLFVKLLPNTKDDLKQLNDGEYSGSRVGGFLFLTITMSSVLAAILISLFNVLTGGVS